MLGVAAFCVSCWLSVLPAPTLPARAGAAADLSMQVFSQSREALSWEFYEKADTVYHGGQEHLRAEAFSNRFFQAIHNQISPREHTHLSGRAMEEIMPWLWMAVRARPHNSDAYLVAAFWLAGDMGRPDLAHEVLREGQCENPFNYALAFESGRVYLREGDVNGARHAFDVALAFWPRPTGCEDPNARLDKASILFYRAMIHEYDGEPGAAIAGLEEILALFPDRTAVSDRIGELKRGEPSVLASQLWRARLASDDKERKACHREDAHEHAEGDAPAEGNSGEHK